MNYGARGVDECEVPGLQSVTLHLDRLSAQYSVTATVRLFDPETPLRVTLGRGVSTCHGGGGEI